jgi:hypothetical protein
MSCNGIISPALGPAGYPKNEFVPSQYMYFSLAISSSF